MPGPSAGNPSFGPPGRDLGTYRDGKLLDDLRTPAAARYDQTLGEYLLPYEAVRSAADPEAILMAFLQSTYEAAANAGRWDRASLECDFGAPGVPRRVSTP